MDSSMDSNWQDFCHPSHLSKKRVKTLVCFLHALIEKVSLIGNIHGPNAESLERLNEFGDIFFVLGGEGQTSIRIVRLSPKTGEEHCCSFLGAGVRSAARS